MMGVHRGAVMSSHHAMLSDPLAPMRGLAPSRPSRLSYSSSSGSDRSHGTSEASDGTSVSDGSGRQHHIGDMVSDRTRTISDRSGRHLTTVSDRSRTASDWSNSTDDTNYHQSKMDTSTDSTSRKSDHSTSHKSDNGSLNLTLDVPTRKLLAKSANSTLDYPHLKVTNASLDSLHFASPPKKIHKVDNAGNSKRTSSSQHSTNRVSTSGVSTNTISTSRPSKDRKYSNDDKNPPTHYRNPQIYDIGNDITPRKTSKFFSSPANQFKASKPTPAPPRLHGVFYSRLHGPLASLQPLDSVLRPKSAPRRKRFSSAVFHSNSGGGSFDKSSGGNSGNSYNNEQSFNSVDDKENVELYLGSDSEDVYNSLTTPTASSTLLHHLTTIWRPSLEAPHTMAPDGGFQAAPMASNGPHAEGRPLKKVSGVWKALAGRLHLAMGNKGLEGANFPPPPSRDQPTPPPHSPSPPLPPPNRTSTLPRKVSSTSSNSGVAACGVTEPPATKRMVRAMYSYKAAQKGDLSLSADEEYEVLEETEEHWWRLRDARGNEGFSPSNYVKDATNIGLHQYDWYLGDATRQRAEAMLLREEREGCFLVRNSSSGSGALTISVFCAAVRPQVKHYHIQKDTDGRFYLSQNIKCTTIAELIYKHQYNPGGLCTRLRSAPQGNKPPTTAGFGRDKWDIPLPEITLLEEIGSGQFGVVHRGKYRNNVVAVKMMKEGTMSEDEFIEEAKVMTKLQHPNLVQLYGVCKRQRPVYIITEYLEYGSLLHYLRQQEKHLGTKADTLIDMCLQISEGMAYLEKEKFIHRDLAARNCLVGSANIKVGDFGLARYVVDDEYTGSGGAKFPIKWAAPEVLNYMRFSSKSDVWAFGVLMWEVFTCGKMPYGRRKNADVVAMVQEGRVLDRPRHCPAPVYGVMRGCWATGAEERPGFGELVGRIRDLNEELNEADGLE